MPPPSSTPPIFRQPNPIGQRPRTSLGGLWQQRMCGLPTWRGWIVVLLVSSFVFIFAGRHLCRFLMVNDPVPGGVLVVEGWLPTYALRETLAEFHRQPYLGIYVTGLPIEDGNPYSSYRNYAEFTSEKLRMLGAPAESVHAVPSNVVNRDRTYNMADALKAELGREGVSAAKINIISLGPHSRRSRLLYKFAFGPQTQVGMIGISQQEFDPDHWWRNSEGFRTVIGESLAYLYARFVFHPS